ncbi:hypothetical protein O181_088601 [Austropuccinia psidii MF-1]|uniref:Uncharacterized protein n=1 Tax=Austropuccinia psidii MF-1 TaxID=1389203 RepID=A0A9Q3P736_9BASI|nr:hypothetical protein [Austropuccinia psidii MF-1]
MNPLGQSYGLGYSDLIKVFSTDELEELLFGCPSSPSRSTTFWDWVNSPHSTPPALAPISNASSPFSYSEEVPEAAMAFYAFMEGKYDPCLLFQTPSIIFQKRGPPLLLNPKDTISREECTPTIYAPVIPMDGLLQLTNYIRLVLVSSCIYLLECACN